MKRIDVSTGKMEVYSPEPRDPCNGSVARNIAPKQNCNVPAEPSDDVFLHTVEKGDTMWGIAKVHGVSLDELVDANPGVKYKDWIFPGDVLAVPLDRGGEGQAFFDDDSSDGDRGSVSDDDSFTLEDDEFSAVDSFQFGDRVGDSLVSDVRRRSWFGSRIDKYFGRFSRC